MVQDKIADMLTRVRNASSAKHATVDVPASNMKKAIAEVLLEEGYVKNIQFIDDMMFVLRKIVELDNRVFDLNVIDGKPCGRIVFFRLGGKSDEIIHIVMIARCPDQTDTWIDQSDLFYDWCHPEKRLARQIHHQTVERSEIVLTSRFSQPHAIKCGRQCKRIEGNFFEFKFSLKLPGNELLRLVANDAGNDKKTGNTINGNQKNNGCDNPFEQRFPKVTAHFHFT